MPIIRCGKKAEQNKPKRTFTRLGGAPTNLINELGAKSEEALLKAIKAYEMGEYQTLGDKVEWINL